MIEFIDFLPSIMPVKSRNLMKKEIRGGSKTKKDRIMQSLSGAPEEIRTPDRSVRSRLLYPAELRVHSKL